MNEGATLTADLVARAVIAAARAYGDDPARVCTADRKRAPRALVAAAGGLALAMDRSPTAATRVLGLGRNTVHSARFRRCAAYAAAERAAMRAAEFALWRPDAVEDDPGGAAAAEQPPRASVRVAVIARGVKTELGGAISARARPSPPPPLISAARVAQADRPVGDLVLEALAGGPLNSMSLAARIDRKEMPVSSALSQLERDGLVVWSPAPDDAPRRFVWRLAANITDGEG